MRKKFALLITVVLGIIELPICFFFFYSIAETSKTDYFVMNGFDVTKIILYIFFVLQVLMMLLIDANVFDLLKMPNSQANVSTAKKLKQKKITKEKLKNILRPVLILISLSFLISGVLFNFFYLSLLLSMVSICLDILIR